MRTKRISAMKFQFPNFSTLMKVSMMPGYLTRNLVSERIRLIRSARVCSVAFLNALAHTADIMFAAFNQNHSTRARFTRSQRRRLHTCIDGFGPQRRVRPLTDTAHAQRLNDMQADSAGLLSSALSRLSACRSLSLGALGLIPCLRRCGRCSFGLVFAFHRCALNASQLRRCRTQSDSAKRQTRTFLRLIEQLLPNSKLFAQLCQPLSSRSHINAARQKRIGCLQSEKRSPVDVFELKAEHRGEMWLARADGLLELADVHARTFSAVGLLGVAGSSAGSASVSRPQKSDSCSQKYFFSFSSTLLIVWPARSTGTR